MAAKQNHEEPGGAPLTARDRRKEQRLVASICRHQAGLKESALALFELYAGRHHDAKAREIGTFVISAPPDPAERATVCLGLGLRMERARRYELAAWAYETGIAYEPTDPDVWYWLNNNLAFSLNQFGAHVAAEPYCRAALRADARRHNAYKNLGVALQGQGQYADAARAYITAVSRAPGDTRSMHHLGQLVEAHRNDIAASVPEAIAMVEQYAKSIEDHGGTTARPTPPGTDDGG